MTKTCAHCGEPFESALRCPWQKYCSARCREAAWRKRNPTRVKEYFRAYRKEHPQQMLEYNQKYLEKNRSKQRAWKRSRRAREGQVVNRLTQGEAAEKLQSGKCFYCGHPAKCLDHFWPLSLNGPTVRANTVLSCRSCNAQKGATPPHYFISQLAIGI